jgi:hypothetical protein
MTMSFQRRRRRGLLGRENSASEVLDLEASAPTRDEDTKESVSEKDRLARDVRNLKHDLASRLARSEAGSEYLDRAKRAAVRGARKGAIFASARSIKRKRLECRALTISVVVSDAMPNQRKNLVSRAANGRDADE